MMFIKLSTLVLASLLFQVTGIGVSGSEGDNKTVRIEDEAVRIEDNITETIWHYVDDDISYQLHFAANGQLFTTHPHDVTPDNDVWKQSEGVIHFSYNNNFSVYEGTMVHEGLIEGTARNKNHEWKWKAYRVDVN
ncbi:hypothetical protein R9C00_01195 [Flammeovirgaceae bacterium SG7u.111]|nr:hypothetical protein [Flammeovirgaceae bacterium SG7u.132]WPO36064.1 hypothetical protein R9C00_01195 [Flammeovirgaceae bacterium SG7u.111]